MRYFPFDGEVYQPKLGLNPLALTHWLEVDENWETHLSLKRQILNEHPEDSFQYRPAAGPGALELRALLSEHLVREFPDRYRINKQELFVNGRCFPPPASGEEALWQIGQWTQEDWVLLSAEPPVTVEAGSVCFPSRWSIREKVGLDSAGIHAPVPSFDKIARPTQNFLERITVEKPIWRLNWTIHDSDELFCPAPPQAATGLTAQNVLARTFLRMERQTLRRLPASRAVVFSIRTHVHSMEEAANTPERREAIRRTLQGLPPETAAYRGMRGFQALLIEALRT